MITHTDCRSAEGIAVGLIDGMLAAARVLCGQDLTSPPVVEAMKDFAQDEGIQRLLAKANSTLDSE